MLRRNFLKTSALALGSLALPSSAFAEKKLAKGKRKTDLLIKPARLKKGDRIGLIAPGSYIRESELAESVKNLQTLGFEPVYTENVLARSGYLGGTDKQRASDVNLMFSRKDINGIVCVRGGYGCQRILPMLDYQMIRRNPKVISGYSDITALLYGLYSQTGLVGFHGPVATSTFNDFSVNYFTKTLIEPSATLVMESSREEDPNDLSRKPYAIRSGCARGPLVGGNLSIVVSLVGTPYDIDTKGKIVFLEEISEEPYRVDRMLTQLIQAGKLKDAAGIVLGVFTGCEPKKHDPEFSSSFTLQEVLFDRLYTLGIPVIYGLSFGHIINKFTIPVGVKAALDVDQRTLTLLEPAVV